MEEKKEMDEVEAVEVETVSDEEMEEVQGGAGRVRCRRCGNYAIYVKARKGYVCPKCGKGTDKDKLKFL